MTPDPVAEYRAQVVTWPAGVPSSVELVVLATRLRRGAGELPLYGVDAKDPITVTQEHKETAHEAARILLAVADALRHSPHAPAPCGSSRRQTDNGEQP